MLKFENKKGEVKINAVGSVVEICKDVAMCIGCVYDSLSKNNEKDAEAFKDAIQSAVKDGIMFLKLEEEKPKEKPVKNNKLNEAINILKELIEELKK